MEVNRHQREGNKPFGKNSVPSNKIELLNLGEEILPNQQDTSSGWPISVIQATTTSSTTPATTLLDSDYRSRPKTEWSHSYATLVPTLPTTIDLTRDSTKNFRSRN